MEKSGAVFRWVLLGILLPLAWAENIEEPRANVNLNPFQQWRSAVECMMNVSAVCSTQNMLTLNGTIDVPQTELDDFCNKGCSQHTIDVLNCIRYVKRDFRFSNKATVWTLHNLIDEGCSGGTAITTPDWKSSGAAAGASEKAMVAFVLSTASLAFLALLEMQAYH